MSLLVAKVLPQVGISPPFCVLKLGSGGQSSKSVGLHMTECSDSLTGVESLIFVVVIMKEMDTVRFS